MLTANTKFNKKNLAFGLPNTSAMFLSFSNTLWKESDSYLKDDSNFITPISKFIGPVNLNVKSKESFLDKIEKSMGAVVFSYTSLESFANQSIPSEYIFRQSRKDQKYIEEYNREQIERFVSLDTKLLEVLPAVFQVVPPKNGKIWNGYSDLKKLRDRIIHLKSNDAKSTGPEVNTIWTALVNTNSSNPAVEAKNMIRHFYPDVSKQPRWLKKCPF